MWFEVFVEETSLFLLFSVIVINFISFCIFLYIYTQG